MSGEQWNQHVNLLCSYKDQLLAYIEKLEILRCDLENYCMNRDICNKFSKLKIDQIKIDVSNLCNVVNKLKIK